MYTQETMKAFVDAIIPRSPRLAEEYGKIQYFGALDFHTDEYITFLLNHYNMPFSIMGSFNRFTMMGYYSEWYGYGSTRLETPDQRRLEFFPLSWEQVEYPGPSLGYRVLR
ncbi:MAG: hypothetical protein AAGU75_08320 [Bacillota bacterium]